MLKLRGAPFNTKDERLVPRAGACGTCPKRTGNQSELFGDVKGNDVCTDPECFAAKVKAAGDAKVARAKEQGREVIVGPEAERIAQYGVNNHLQGGYIQTTQDTWTGDNWQPVKKTIAGELEPVLLQDPRTGKTVEVVKKSEVDRIVKRNKPGGESNNTEQVQRAKNRQEKKARMAAYHELRPLLPAPDAWMVASYLMDQLPHDRIKVVAAMRGWEPPTKKETYSDRSYKDYYAFGKELDKLETEAEVWALVNDILFSRDVETPMHSNRKPEMLEGACANAGVDIAAHRRAAKPAKKKAKRGSKAKASK
jgi:hypothetical protein